MPFSGQTSTAVNAVLPPAGSAKLPADERPARNSRGWSRYRSNVCAVLLAACTTAGAIAQARPAGVRAGDLQVGAGFSIGDAKYPDYTVINDLKRVRGFAFYSSFDFRRNFGVELDFHQANKPSPSVVYERTYEVGGRYVRHYSIFNPYVRLMYGRGVFNYPQNVANLAYNMGILGGGVDINVRRHINVRADYEYQQWYGFHGNLSSNGSNTLSPYLFTIGAAYHFQ